MFNNCGLFYTLQYGKTNFFVKQQLTNAESPLPGLNILSPFLSTYVRETLYESSTGFTLGRKMTVLVRLF
jgi:hypothetical protein